MEEINRHLPVVAIRNPMSFTFRVVSSSWSTGYCTTNGSPPTDRFDCCANEDPTVYGLTGPVDHKTEKNRITLNRTVGLSRRSRLLFSATMCFRENSRSKHLFLKRGTTCRVTTNVDRSEYGKLETHLTRICSSSFPPSERTRS